MRKFNRHIYAIILSVVATLSNASFAATESAPDPRQTEFNRLHDAAVAFSEAVKVIAVRYDNLRTVDLTQAKRLIMQSEQAAQQQQFETATLHARAAYEMLRNSITSAVAHPL